MIGTISVKFRCSTREVAFLFGHAMAHHKKEHDGDNHRHIRMITDKRGVDLLSIGVASPLNKRKTSGLSKTKVKVAEMKTNHFKDNETITID